MSDLELPYAYGNPPLTAVLRSTPEDFQVEEILGYDADGNGEHALLWVEKRGANTDWVARELAKFAGIPPLNVGYAGLKDRHAVTRQTFSVQLAGKPDPDWSAFPAEGVKVLAATRHTRKLKRGALRGNRFVLVLRQVDGDRAVADQILKQIAQRGVPNYFAKAATWRRRAQCLRVDGWIATSVIFCCRLRDRTSSTRYWRHASNATPGIRRWTVRSGRWPGRARGLGRSRSTLPCRSDWPRETFILRVRCGGVAKRLHRQRWHRWKTPWPPTMPIWPTGWWRRRWIRSVALCA